MASEHEIVIRGAKEHNLKGISLQIPRGKFTVITGVSGSGKSSLAFDTLFREGQRRFLETIPAYGRSLIRGIDRPDVASIQGIGPAVGVNQRANLKNPRSTVGTITEVWDYLRLLFARLGDGASLSRSQFSFNDTEGACPKCRGIGMEDCLDASLILNDPKKSLRSGALQVSTPNGYLMYSQVTLDVLDQVLQAHGGNIDTPWEDLTQEVQHVVYYGSERVVVPFGKHTLESRMKWTGITARPRSDGYYRGLLPVMEEILKTKRNDSILKYVRTVPCSECAGARLNQRALEVLFHGRKITDYAAMSAKDLATLLQQIEVPSSDQAVFDPIRKALIARCDLMRDLGVGYLRFDRGSSSISIGEAQRLRLLSLALGELRGVLVVLDEPSAGLHPQDMGSLLGVLRGLCDRGQTVVVVDHDPVVAQAADWLVELGPGPGHKGGSLLFSGPPGKVPVSPACARQCGEKQKPSYQLNGLSRNNLKNICVNIHAESINIITGVSGAGKTSLLDSIVDEILAGRTPLERVIRVDSSPIGRSPRSNAATYTGAFDWIRDVFAALPQSRALGFGKGHFSFNTPGGRCEACEGAGRIEMGMRYLGTVELVCEQCGGKRFHSDILELRYRGKTISDVLDLSVDDALLVFSDHAKLNRVLSDLSKVGLGYLSLGQSAMGLSGGEAQRIKPASAPSTVALRSLSSGFS